MESRRFVAPLNGMVKVHGRELRDRWCRLGHWLARKRRREPSSGGCAKADRIQPSGSIDRLPLKGMGKKMARRVSMAFRLASLLKKQYKHILLEQPTYS